MNDMRITFRAGTAATLLPTATVSACSGDGSGTAPAAVATATASSSLSAAPDRCAAEEVARGLDVPWGLTFLPVGDALIAERDTVRILRLTPGGGEPRPVAEVPGVAPVGEGGLLGIAR
jgi:glucose/arabinose dehydrogenase